ncbi:MAG: SCO family protein [Gammaproteobacteria bacterium]
MTEQVDQKIERSNTTLWLLILTFAIPIIAAYAYFFFVDDYSMGNHGELIQPIIHIESLALTNINGEPIAQDELIHHWKMLYIADKDCDSACQETIYFMRQINTALGKNAGRFKHMIIHLETMSPEFKQLTENEYPSALHSYAFSSKLSDAFSGLNGELVSNSIYIMDPLGNIMMRFNQGTSPKMILKDLKRLLKISRIG